MSKQTTINNPIEKDTNRNEFVLNQNAGALVFTNTTGNQRVQLTSKSGSNIYMNDKVVSTLATNNCQSLTKGDKFDTTERASYERSCKDMEKRAGGDFNIITGNVSQYKEKVNEKWLNAYLPIAVAKTSPERQYPAVGNNTNAEFEGSGSTNPDGSGSAAGGDWKESGIDIAKLVEETVPDLTEIETQMGTGGNIKLSSAKHLTLIAGTTPANYDSGIIIKDAIPVDGEYIIGDDKTHVLNTISVPVFEEKDTSSALPFGDVHVKANGKLMLEAGSGGVDLNTSGNVKLTTSGRLLLGGADVTIGGSTSNNAGTVRINVDNDVFIDSGVIVTTSAPIIKTNASSQYSIKSPQTVIDGDLHIAGDLHVTGEITAGGDVIAGNGSVSLLSHIHGNGKDGADTTGPK
jgi:hypothetical protein|tara:strand:+ start:797 stop:2008 length:1212 start_codon:yes stop_codon:yes gene_type:complete